MSEGEGEGERWRERGGKIRTRKNLRFAPAQEQALRNVTFVQSKDLWLGKYVT